MSFPVSVSQMISRPRYRPWPFVELSPDNQLLAIRREGHRGTACLVPGKRHAAPCPCEHPEIPHLVVIMVGRPATLASVRPSGEKETEWTPSSSGFQYRSSRPVPALNSLTTLLLHEAIREVWLWAVADEIGLVCPGEGLDLLASGRVPEQHGVSVVVAARGKVFRVWGKGNFCHPTLDCAIPGVFLAVLSSQRCREPSQLLPAIV